MRQLHNKGFSLIEVAIVLIVVGLLASGIMKGKEMYKNSKLLAQVQQFQKIREGVKHFKDLYGTWPSDITRTDCATFGWATLGANCSNVILSSTGNVDNGTSNSFWLQLSKGVDGIITENDISTSSNKSKGLDGVYDINGVFQIDATRSTSTTFGKTQGNHLVNKDERLRASEAKLIDSKLDDGIASTGFVFGIGTKCSGTALGSDYSDPSNSEDKDACKLLFLMDSW